ncbi:ABC transporter substrate-binding protein [Brachybacterium sp. NBEC-018]|uniref:ABC transporter substrate-binding protein n=1 Tax=Brachybacterium sp. NBEC-018 TaxID=2996004 RepID=UPI00217537E4|nr:ABC transporter substrate-binding protein [Brachybacterium sp. NBEC-018]UVY84441.1 ABC transporter substrate-binding protein [Brachybacterium sp. NBEC-018]
MTALRRRTFAAALAAAPLLGLAACADEGTASSSSSAGSDASDGGAAGTRTVSTVKGDVEVPADPQRIVVLNYALAGYLFDLDLPVAATTTEAAEVDGSFSEFWGDAPTQAGTQMLSWSSDGFDLEAVLGMEPDLIVAGGWGFPYFQADKAYEDLSAIAPTVLVDKALTSWREQFSFLAEHVFDRKETLDELVAAYEDRLAEVKAAITLPPQPISLLYVTGEGTPFVFLEDFVPAEFEGLGFEIDPIASTHELEPYTAGGDSAELSTENLGQLVTSPTVFVCGFNQDTFTVEELGRRAVWKDLPAFQDGHAYDLPYWASRHDYDEALALLDLLQETFAG